MIQRIQTAYLLLGCTASVAPIALGLTPLSPAAPNWVEPLRLLLFGLSAGIGFLSIFLYSNRGRQLVVALGAFIAALVCLVVVLATFVFYAVTLPGIEAAFATRGAVVTTIAPLVSGAFYYAARRGIASDIKLVKSMDRLRD
jgi:hypothetical protein